MRSRDAIIRATLELMNARGFSGVTISAVADAAGVTRQTVYNTFGSREELVSQAMLSVAIGVVRDIEAQLADIDSAAAYLAEMMVVGRRETRRHPVMAALLRVEPGNPIFDEGMMERARPVAAHLLAPLRAREPTLADAETFDAVLELATRLGISVMFFDSDLMRTDEDLRRMARRWLDPMFPSTD